MYIPLEAGLHFCLLRGGGGGGSSQLLVTSMMLLRSEWAVAKRGYSAAGTEYRFPVIGHMEGEKFGGSRKVVRRTVNMSYTTLV